MSVLSRRAFLARAAAASIVTPLLVEASAAWGDSIDFRADGVVEGLIFVWPDRLVVAGPGAVVRRCAFLGPWKSGATFLAGHDPDGTAGSSLVILDARACEVSHCLFDGCKQVTPAALASAEAWVGGGWREMPRFLPPALVGLGGGLS